MIINFYIGGMFMFKKETSLQQSLCTGLQQTDLK